MNTLRQSTSENILDNIENLLEKSPENKLTFSSEEKIPISEEITFKTDQLIKEDPKCCLDLIKELFKNSLLTNSSKNEHLLNLKKLIADILQQNDEKNFVLYFDEIFFEKLEVLTEKKEVFQSIEIIEMIISLISSQKLLLMINGMKENRRIFTMLLNYLMSINESLNFNTIGIAVRSSLRFLLEFLKKNS